MIRRVSAMVFGLIAAGMAAFSWAAPVSVPPQLEGWRGWALDGQEFRRCPFLAGHDTKDRDAFKCEWPARLSLSLESRGGHFTQRWQVYAQSWVRLPGNVEHWPQNVRVDGAPGAVVMHDGFPALQLAAGDFAVSGEFEWSVRPESLEIDPRTALVELSIDGRNVAQPERPGGAVWLGKRRSAEQPERMEVQVYRLLRDQVPAELITRIRLQVAGDAREEFLARALPETFVPVSLEGPLPARLEPDGRLRVQVRPGSWELTLAARGQNVATELKRPAGEGRGAREEIWSFQSDDRLRIAAIEGAEGVDPGQANVPQEWRRFPAFRMAPDSRLVIAERSRGLQNADDNRLSIERNVWLDFDHGGMTAVDHIHGRMLRDWRLETATPFAVQSATSGSESLLITRNAGTKGVGLELRSANVDIQATTRSASGRGAVPASGWNARFDSVSGEFNLPPGHRLLAVAGADRAPTAWFDQWGLWGVFGVLVVAVFAGWLIGTPVGVMAFVALLLTYQEEPAMIWLWSNLIAAIALARAAPEGRLLRFARGYRLMAFIVLGIALLPLALTQLRAALYPQLAAAGLPRPPPIEALLLAEAPAQAEAPRAMVVPQMEIASDALGAAAPSEEITVTAAKRRDNNANASSAPVSVRGTSGLNYQQVVQRYAPGTLLQTGPGIPRWRYEQHPFSWSGPVEATQSVRFIYIGPWLLGLWRIAGVVLLAALFAVLLRSCGHVSWRWPPGGLNRSASATASVILALMALVTMPTPTQAQMLIPDSDTLEELTARLTRAPECEPSCADIASARAVVRPESLEILLEVSALTTIAVPMPAALDRWQLQSVSVDGRASLAVSREGDDSLWIPLSPGAHTVRLEGRLAAAESIQVTFPAPPRHVTVTSEGWDVAGVNEGRLVSGSLELTRRRGSTERAGPLDSASDFPAFARVTRDVDLGLDWSVTTSVERIAPQKAAFSIEVPLIRGESVLSADIEVHDGKDGSRAALIGLERGQQSAQWSGGLPRSEQLDLQLPAKAGRAEVWRFTVSPQWNVEFIGMPAVLPADEASATWVYEFHPRPGEKLQLKIRRPERADGPTLAIDAVDQSLQIGKRSTTTTLALTYRSTQGGRHAIGLPKEARVTAVRIDGSAVQLRPVGNELPLELRPGAHAVSVEWITQTGAGLGTQPPSVDLHSPSSNLSTRIQLPADRWPLLAFGGGVGPAIVYWGELVVFIALAWVLGRWRHSPLRTHEWLLLGFGLSTRSWAVLVLVALWLFALRWREGWSGSVSRWRFNFMQVALAMLTVIAVGALVFSGIRGSLLASPDMGVAGDGSYGNAFAWFHDRSAALLPQPTVVSVPMWIYRVLMFAWALWLVFALLGWLRWAWRAWRANGAWRAAPAKERVDG